MSRPRPPEPAFVVMGVLVAAAVDPGAVMDRIEAGFGPARSSTPWLPFDSTRYYEREMGPGIRRAFLWLGEPVDPSTLADLKERSNRLEGAWTDPQGRRRVNLDPGVLGLANLVLATGKPAAHRVYLARGIYAEVEYRFERGSFRPLPWTYPDYRAPETIAFFNRVRESYRQWRARRAPSAEERSP
ncbi:DUF4416 family protein [Deferrisoma camini]|uniref:DUF4416 family protein n=1 Tax=Deferrisoma camini TaxID=1035120 RepID=UPI00046D5C77|nr:DUF4416 family protein [Deferrisoma camini]